MPHSLAALLTAAAMCQSGTGAGTPKLPDAPPLAEPAPARPDERPVVAKAEAEAEAPEILNVGELLVALEAADRGIDTLEASVVYDRRFAMQGDQHIRFGTLLFETRARADGAGRPARRAFYLHFERLFVNGRQQNEDVAFIFDGEWLVEKNAIDRLFTKRLIAPPGKPVDPFRVGDAPMIPLPIGQRKDDIERRYQVAMLAPLDILTEEKGYADHVKDAYQLRLVPHNWSPREPFQEIRLWYQKGSLLPLLSRTINRQGDEYYVQLVNVKLNQPEFPREKISVEPPPPEEGYNVQIEERPVIEPEDGTEAPVTGRGMVNGPAVKS